MTPSADIKGLVEALREMSDMRFGVSGKSASQVNDWFNERARQALASISSREEGAATGSGVYVASRASVLARGQMWRDLRAKGAPIISTWIDEDGPNDTADLDELWVRIQREVTSASCLVLYVEADDFPLKGAFVEIGMALAANVPIIIVAPGVEITGRNQRPFGSWIKHPLVSFAPSVESAIDREHLPAPATQAEREAVERLRRELHYRTQQGHDESTPYGDVAQVLTVDLRAILSLLEPRRTPPDPRPLTALLTRWDNGESVGDLITQHLRGEGDWGPVRVLVGATTRSPSTLPDGWRERVKTALREHHRRVYNEYGAFWFDGELDQMADAIWEVFGGLGSVASGLTPLVASRVSDNGPAMPSEDGEPSASCGDQ